MLIVDTALKQRAASGNPIRVGMIGAGFMARGIANQIINSVPGMELVAISNRTLANAERAYREAGAEFKVVNRLSDINDNIRGGVYSVTDDATLLTDAEGIDCLLEVTGAIEFGAQITMRAIQNRKHMVSMNAELDGTVGPIIKKHADKAGVIFSGSDGDQPGVQM